jgi:hypothetical protein
MEFDGKCQIMLKSLIYFSAPAIFLLSLLSWGGCQLAPKKPDVISPGDYRYVVDYTEYKIHQLVRRHHLPSVAVAIIDDQNTVWQETFGWANIEKKIRAQSDTVYKLWSVAKVFTAIETMRLVGKGWWIWIPPSRITSLVSLFKAGFRIPGRSPFAASWHTIPGFRAIHAICRCPDPGMTSCWGRWPSR